MPYNLFLQNKTNNRALDYEARDNVTVGRNVSNRITQGDYIVNHTSGEFKIRAGNQIELKQGTVITPTGTGSVKIFLDDIEASCRPANREMETKADNLTYYRDNRNLLAKNNYAFKNYPNPFSTNTTFEYQLLTASMIELSLYNLQGIKVDEIEVLNKKEVGNYSINYNAKDLASGFYIGVLKVDGNITNTIKVQLFN